MERREIKEIRVIKETPEIPAQQGPQGIQGEVGPQGPAWNPTRFRMVIAESDFLTISTPFGVGLVGSAVSSGTIAGGTGDVNHPGVAILRDSTTANGGYRVTTEVGAFRLSGGEKVVCVFRRNTVRTTVQFRIGFHDSTSSSDPVDGVYLQYIASTGVLEARTRNNNSQTIAGTTFSLSNNTWVTAVIEVVSSSQATFTIFDESGTQLWQETITTNIPTSAGRETGAGVIATESSTDAAADIVQLDYLQVTINRDLVR